MNKSKLWGLSLVVALLVAACGGGDPYVPGSGLPSGAPTTKGTFTAVVSFGDSLSDLGTYTPATVIPGTNPPVYMGGKWTTNSATSTVWVENVATAMGLMITPAEVGFAGQSVRCPIAATYPSLANTCTGYGQGGALVSDPNGVRHSAGALTVPVKTQIANHLAQFGSFKPTDLIFVQAVGGNEIFMQMDPTIPGSLAATLAQVQAGLAASPPTLTADQAHVLVFQAQMAAQGAMKQAALDLANLITTQVLANGGKYVAVMNVPDLGSTPEGAAQSALVTGLLTTLSDTFNLWLREGLTNQPVLWFDIEALFRDVVANPSAHGIVNVSTPACDPARMAAITGGVVKDGSSLFCNATPGAAYNGLQPGADVMTWFFADGNHPTTGGHKVFSDTVITQLKAAGWI